MFDVLDNVGCAPLKAAVKSGSRECCTLLLTAGADATRRDPDGSTFLHELLSCHRSDWSMMTRPLVSHGVDVNARTFVGISASDLAMRIADHSGLCTLFAMGAEVPVIESESTQTALLRARAAEVCIGLQSMHLPALLLVEIIRFACASVSDNVPFDRLWTIVTTIKHFRDVQ
jgi:hypothetical protein